MKTIDQFLTSIFGEANWDYSELKEYCPDLVEQIIKETKTFIEEAIKADRINVAEHADVGMNEGGLSIELQIANGYVFVDKNSIINAPNIEIL